MKFGVFSVADHYPQEIDRTAGQFFRELTEQAVYADELGFDSFWLAEHHFHEYGAIPRPAMLLGVIAEKTSKIKLGSAVTVLPFDHPLRTAEDFAVLDILSNGRACLGVGSGYLQHEFTGFNLSPAEKRDRFDESLEVLLKAFSGERFSFNGKYYQLNDVCLNVRPVQQPHPEMYVAILSNAAARFVGEKGFPIMMIPYATTESFDELAGTVTEFRNGFDKAGGRVHAASVPFGLHAFCTDDYQRDKAMIRECMDRYVRTRLYAKQRPYDLLVEKSLVAFGTPDMIIEVAKKYENAGLTHFLSIMNFGGMEHRKVLRSMKLMAEEVIPAFK